MIISPTLAYLEQSKCKLANEFAMVDSGDLSLLPWYSNDVMEGIKKSFYSHKTNAFWISLHNLT